MEYDLLNSLLGGCILSYEFQVQPVPCSPYFREKVPGCFLFEGVPPAVEEQEQEQEAYWIQVERLV